jgi:hypothetical protein
MPKGIYIRTEKHLEILRKVNKSRVGFKHSEETKKRIGEKNRGKIQTPKHKLKNSISHNKEFKDCCKQTKHRKIELEYGKPKYCEVCKKTDEKKYV